MSVSSRLVLFVSAASNRDTYGPWVSLPSTSSSSDNTKYMMNPRIKESYGTILEILTGHEWTQYLTSPFLHYGTTQRHQPMPCGLNQSRRGISSVLNQNRNYLSQDHGVNEGNNRMVLILNKINPHRMLSPATLNFCPGLNWPHKDNTGTPVSNTSRLVTTARLLRPRVSLSTPLDTSPAASTLASSSVPMTQNTIVNTRWKHYQN